MSLKTKPVALRIEDYDIARIFNRAFLDDLGKALPAPFAWFMHLKVGTSKHDGGTGAEDISLYHTLPLDGKPSSVVVAAEKTETVETIVRALEKVA